MSGHNADVPPMADVFAAALLDELHAKLDVARVAAQRNRANLIARRGGTDADLFRWDDYSRGVEDGLSAAYEAAKVWTHTDTVRKHQAELDADRTGGSEPEAL